MFREFMNGGVISPASFKEQLTEAAMHAFAKQPDVVLVHSPVLYRFYVLFSGDKVHIEDRPVFFRKVGAYLYYERFTCQHGDEFYYYVKFNKNSPFYQEHKALISILIEANEPKRLLYDYIGTKDLSQYGGSGREIK